MNKAEHIRRGDVYYADLRPAVGSEQNGIRPVLIIQNDIGNEHSPTVIAAAITSSRKKRLPTHVVLDSTPGLYRKSSVLLEQLRTLDKSRLLEYVCSLEVQTMELVDTALDISIGTFRQCNDRTWNESRVIKISEEQKTC